MSRLAGLLLLLLLFSGCQGSKKPQPTASPSASESPEPPPASYVGSESCKGCHQEQFGEWSSSDHHEAMRLPTDATVLGDFDNSEFDYFGFRSRFYKKGDEFWVETDGPQGLKKSFKVEYTFGFEPLQQYLVKFPDGRLQALSICWDTEKSRWFHLHPEEPVTSKSRLHWTAPQYNWNFMCAECHSTGLEKNYDSETDTFKTAYEEINVSCEACHGPGSGHLESVSGEPLPNHGFVADLTGRGPWQAQTETLPPRPRHPDKATDQLDTCARCHSRRAIVSSTYQHGESIDQTHAVAVLQEGLYHADGQIDDEVYVYGSFLQSKMYGAGVVCTDCHNPHTSKLKIEGDKLCLQCHLPKKYAVLDHSHHQNVSCVDCHMVGKVYMGNDYRRDHSFRIPRPDLSKELGTPNACTECHQDQTLDWASAAYLKWYGKGDPHYGQLLKKGRAADHRAAAGLSDLVQDPSVPDIVRATAVSLVPNLEVLEVALADPSSLVRREAVRMLQRAPVEMRANLVKPLLQDPVLTVRIEVGRALAATGSQDAEVKAVIEEYRESLLSNADRMESRLGMAELALLNGDTSAAEEHFLSALKLDPRSPQAYVNLADFYRQTGREEDGEALLREGLQALSVPDTASVHHALGLLLVRKGDYDQALGHLKSATDQSPTDDQFSYVYAIALDGVGANEKAIAELERTLKQRPYDRRMLSALISFLDKAGQKKKADEYRARL